MRAYLAWKPVELALATIPSIYFGLKWSAIREQKAINAVKPLEGYLN